MRMHLTDVPVGDKAPEEVNVVIEITQGSSNKIEYDVRYGAFVVDRTLFSSMYYPCNYGFIPSTLFEDGDPLDALVLTSQPIPMGAVLVARPLGVLSMADDKGLDDKIICVFAHDPRFDSMRHLDDLPEHTKTEILHFFKVYKDLEKKDVEVHGWLGVEKAHDLIMSYTIQH